MTEEWSYRLRFGDDVHALEAGELTVGRSRKCDVSVPHPSVSRKHVYLTVGSGRVVVHDLGSSNGTFLNGRKVERETVLRHDDVLRLGDAELRVEILALGEPRTEDSLEAFPSLDTRLSSLGSDISSLAPPLGTLPAHESDGGSGPPPPAGEEMLSALPSFDDDVFAGPEGDARPPDSDIMTAKIDPLRFGSHPEESSRRLLAVVIDAAWILAVGGGGYVVGGLEGVLVALLAAMAATLVVWWRWKITPGQKAAGLDRLEPPEESDLAG